MSDRRWLPTLAELVDRHTILVLKLTYAKSNHNEIIVESAQVGYDIDLYKEKMQQKELTILENATFEIFDMNKKIWEIKDKMAKLEPTNEEYAILCVEAHLINSEKNKQDYKE